MMINRSTRWILMFAVVFAVAQPRAAFAQDAGTNGAVTQNAKGPAVAARAPGLMIRAAINGPEITQTVADVEAPSRQQGVYIDLINALFIGLNQFIPFLPALFDPVGGATTGVGDLIITEIANDGTNTFVEVFNPGSIRIELDAWAFCKVDGCTGPTELAGRVMERDDVLVFQLSGQFDSEFANGVTTLQVGTALDDLGLYDFTGADSRTPTDNVALRDYVQWGDFFGSFGLEEIATSAGLWVVNTSISSSLANMSFQLNADSLTIGGTAEDYTIVPFAQNTLGQVTRSSRQTISRRSVNEFED
ncbi:MAG: hypothetical protein O7D91_04740 [Planctomycetota bacterium]|nr:hypothetical protein [Planctomycetota bacterium]